MSAITQRIFEDVKRAMRARDKQNLSVLRLIQAALKQKEVDERIELDDQIVIQILTKMAKQRRESIAIYQEAQRRELVDKEQFELDVITSYLPETLSEDAVDTLIESVIAEHNAVSPRDIGMVMKSIKSKLAGRADMAQVSAKVKSKLSS